MKKIYKTTTLVASSLFLLLATPDITTGQIIPDNSLPNNSIVTPNGSVLQIDGGTTAGSNLFHSFQEFSVPTGNEAFFNNATTINNIITRVTGGNISNIDGLIRANGSANLFLINPNGMVFGPSARLDIGGSFLGTTANSIEFENGYQFSATTPEAPPLLRVNVPIGLQFNGQEGVIQVRGRGQGLTVSNPFSSPIVRENNGRSLQVNSGRTLALVGGDTVLDGATLTADSGHIELGAVAEGFVSLTPPLSSETQSWDFNYQQVSGFRDVRLSERSAIDASGTGIGSMQIVGRQIALSGGSMALLQNQGPQTFGPIRVRASESVTVRGMTPDSFPSSFRQETVGVGNTGDIDIATQQLAIREGAQIVNRTQGTGNAGNISIRAAESLELSDASPSDPTAVSVLGTVTFNLGSGGDIIISTRDLSVRRGASIASTTAFGTGEAGNIFINATETVELVEFEPRSFFVSSITTASIGGGNSGDVTINTSRAIVRDGGQLSASTLASGNGGRLSLNATDFVEVSGTAPGSINLSLISARTSQAHELLRQAFVVPSGAAGDLEINTPQLNILDGGQVTVRNEGTGPAGNLQVNAEVISIQEGGGITASTRSGEGGNIQLNLDSRLLLRNGSAISAAAGGTGNGGNVTINTETIALLEDSTITANAFSGNGGNIAISTQGIFASPESSITASSQFGVDGIVQINNPDVDSTQGLVELSQQPLEASDRIVRGCGAVQGSQFVITGRGGLPPNPEQQLTGDRPWTDLRDLSAFRGTVRQSHHEAPVVPNAIVEANTWIVNDDGTIELVFDPQVHQAQVQAAMVSCNGTPSNTLRDN